jgi:hypothetical protein
MFTIPKLLGVSIKAINASAAGRIARLAHLERGFTRERLITLSPLVAC